MNPYGALARARGCPAKGRALGLASILGVLLLCFAPTGAARVAGRQEPQAVQSEQGANERPLEVWRATLRAAVEAAELPLWSTVEGWLAWPTTDPALAADWARLLEREGWPDATREQRARAMGAWLGRSADDDGRRVWVEALSRLGGGAAATELSRLCTRSQGEIALEAATAWVALSDDGGSLATFLESRAAGVLGSRPSAMDGALLARLFTGYGSRVADAERELTPAVWGTLSWARHHPDGRVRDASVGALDGVIQRLQWLDRLDRVGPFLKALGGEGWETRELTYRRGVLALSSTAQPELGSASGRRLVRESSAGTDEVSARWRSYGHLLQGVGAYAEGRASEALPHLERAAAELKHLRRARPELRPDVNVFEPFGAAVAVDLVELQGVVAIWRALALRESDRGLADGGYWEALRAVHARSIEAQLLDVAFDTGTGGSSLDGLLDRQLAPRRLIALNDRLPARPRAELLDGLERLLGGLARVAPGELPGFVPEPGAALVELDPRILNPLADPERAALLAGLPLAELNAVERRMANNENRAVWRVRQQQLLEELAQGSQNLERLLQYRTPSAAALFLAEDRRGDGDAAGAADLAGRARDALDASDRNLGLWRDWTAARLALLVGASLTDLDRGPEAASELEGALARLGALVNSLEQRLDELERGRLGVLRLDSVDPAERRALETQIQATRLLEADALVSLAVNANVRLLDSEGALAYFEQAYERRRDDFTTVLLACYRARAGQSARARELLEGVVESPGNYYNLACTHALLGDLDRALGFLARELSPKRHSAGSLARQKEWAASDPDLANLRGDERFEALVAP